MKPHKILRDFLGSQTGNDGPYPFTAGTVADLSDHLAAVMVPAGYATPAEKVIATFTSETTGATQTLSKADEPVTENKASEPVVENKSKKSKKVKA